MDDRSISQFLYPKAIDFSRPPLKIVLIAAIVGLALKFAFFNPHALGSAVERRLLPTEAATIGLERLSSFGMELQDQLLTALPVEDEQLILFVRDRLGSQGGNDLLKSSIPAVFWEVSLRPRDEHTTAFEWREGGANRIDDWSEIHHALVRIDEHGRWFQFYRRPAEAERAARLSSEDAQEIAFKWAEEHPLIIPELKEPFFPSRADRPSIVNEDETNTHQFEWRLPGPVDGLHMRVALEIMGDKVSYYGVEYAAPAVYPPHLSGLRWVMLALRIFLIAGGVLIILILLVKQLRRDAIDFHFSFTYSALLTFPIIAIIIADLPSLMNERLITIAKESFYLLSSSTFLWLILLLLATPVAALTDSLVRQLWPEKLSTFDTLIRGRFKLGNVGRAVSIGLGAGLAGIGVAAVANRLLGGFGGYSHNMFLASLTGPVAVLWAIIGSLGVGLVLGYLLLTTATLLRLRFGPKTSVIGSSVIWLALLFSTGGRYSSLINFGVFALIVTAVSVYLLFRYDLLTLISAQFAGLLSIAAAQLIVSSRPVYIANGVAAATVLGAVVYFGNRLAARSDRALEPEFVPEYIARLQSRERIERDIEIARQLQYTFLPQNLPKTNCLDVATMCRPAHEVGGDYYDFIEFGKNRLGLVIADVSGKGIPAAFYMTMIKGIVQSRSFEEVSPRELLKQMNWVIFKCTETNTFVTLFYAIIDAEQGTLVYSNAGHNPPLIMSRSGRTRELGCGGVVLGVMPQPEYQEESVKLTDGDLLLLYTDGVVETTDVLGAEFGVQRLSKVLKGRNGQATSELILDVSKALDSFAAGAPQTDDITMILVSYCLNEKADNSD